MKVYDKAKMKPKNFARLDREVRSVTNASVTDRHQCATSADAAPRCLLPWSALPTPALAL